MARRDRRKELGRGKGGGGGPPARGGPRGESPGRAIAPRAPASPPPTPARARGQGSGPAPAIAAFALWFAGGAVAAVPVAFLAGAVIGSPAAERAPRGERPASEKPALSASLEVELRCAQAYELKKAERYSEAFEQLARAVEADPRDPRPLLGMAEIYRALDYDERAEEALRKALALDPGNAAAKVSLAMVLCDFGRNREALDILEELEKKRPDDPFVWAEIAINAVRLGDPKAAIPLLERYNEKVGRQAWGFENLGRAHFEAGNFEMAEKCFREAIAINPRTALAHLWLGHLLTAEGRGEEAKAPLARFRELRNLQTQARLLEQAVNRSPEDVEALSRLAHVRTLLGQYAEALVPLERALQLAPDDDRVKRQIEYVRGLAKGGRR